MSAVLEIEGLHVSFRGARGWTEVLRDVSLSVAPGEILGVVGESGSGKSVTSLASMGLLGPSGRIDRGSVRLAGRELTGLDPQALRALRGPEMAMIFQEPGTSLNPVRRVGNQIAEAMTEHGIPAEEARRRSVALMDRVGIPAAESRARDYPHQMSGGMKQRIMIAMALACNPKLLIADEPTTALDVTIQAQILNLILDLRDETGMAVLLITHDMGVVSRYADRVAVMYAGEVVETAPVDRLFSNPGHPYASLLMRAIPNARAAQADLPVIAGSAPPPNRLPRGCRFAPRCPLAIEACRSAPPALAAIGPAHLSRCIRPDQIGRLTGEPA
ncbi:ABC transporter ATP-binding protein [Frigidibacter sp. ROC022]|uniref:ABC transporter ATP-binding protein n=1 Tax=Frigidibacter sp. ROC022 TaxID=2971796 RepID=UPI00215ACEBC|nr:ABC transporter ATP-binding protein [Frigidibacter sp. ROC022]MCR8725417.1 ABC transporter ATP-binding protein [Frigidibacter sp. ROC022]